MANGKRTFEKMTEERFLARDGLTLLVRSWRPAGGARGIVVIVPGFNSHSGYYSRASQQLVADGVTVYAVDLRGRGKSDGERFYVASFSDYVADVHALIELIRRREPWLPIFLFGHGAGGIVSCLYALEHQVWLDGLICESLALQLPMPDLLLVALKGLSHVLPHAPALRLKNEDFSRNPAVVRVMNEDPLITNEVQPINTLAEMVRANDRLRSEYWLFALPLLMLHGTGDKAAKPSGSESFYNTAGSADKTLKLYEGHVHDLLNDVDNQIVIQDIKSWIDMRLPEARKHAVE